MSLLSRAVGKLDTVVGELPPETRDVIVNALREIMRNSAAVGDHVAAHLAAVDEKTKKRATRALEGFAGALAWQLLKGGGFASIGTKLTNASAEAPHMRNALNAAVIDTTALPPKVAG